MDSLKWILPILLIWPAIKLTQIVILVRIIRGLRFGGETVDAVPPEETPDWFLEATRPLAARLEALGFVHSGVSVQRTPLGTAFDNFGLHLSLPAAPVEATLRLHSSAARDGAAYVNLHSTLSDGRELVTADHAEAEIAPLPPELDLEVLPAATPEDLLARHRARLAAAENAGASSSPLAPDARLARGRALLASARERLRASGLAEPARDSADGLALQLRWSAAFAAARRILGATPAEAKAAKAAGTSDTAHLSEHARTSIDLRHYRQMLALQGLRFAWLPKMLLMIGSLVLFAIALRWSLSPVLGLVLIAALAFHEAGHLLGMRLFGFKDTQLLFLPFLGGVAVARDRLVLAPWKHLVILFLGPLPGIVVGTVVLLWRDAFPDPALAKEAGVLILVFNAFNLLPILPLDGGQIMDVALVSRFPRLRVAFLLLSALGLAVVGFASSSALLIFLGVFMLFRLPIEWKQADLVKRLRRELPPQASEEIVLRRLLPELRRVLPPALGASQRFQLVRPLEERVRRPRPSWGTVAFAFAGYVAPLVLCLGLALAVNIQRGERRVAEARARAEAAGLLRLDPPPAPSATVPDERNAALPLLEIERLLAGRWSLAAVPADDRKRALELLADAARRPEFSLPADATSTSDDEGVFDGLPLACRVLTDEADSRLRFGEPGQALELAAQGLAVIQHARGIPTWWTYQADREVRTELWRIIEECLASRASVSEAQLDRLAAATDEAELLSFAQTSILASRVRSARWLGETDSGEESPAFLNALLYVLVRLGPDYFDAQARHYDDTIALDTRLAAILAGKWSSDSGDSAGGAVAEDGEAPGDFFAWNPVDWQLGELADDIAHQRVIRHGLAMHRLVTQGRTPPLQVSAIESPWPLPPSEHPRSASPLRLSRRGPFLVFGMLRDNAFAYQTTDSFEHSWRVPLKE